MFISKKLNMKKNYVKFQGNLKKKRYFEGYYYKITGEEGTISIIVGVSISSDPHSFIQILDNSKKSIYLRFNLNDFSYDKKKFVIQIKNNIFSDEKIYINIENTDYQIEVDLLFHRDKIYPKNIMGPFSYVPFMECKHYIVSYNSRVNGFFKLNEKRINYRNDYLYLEKDYGTSFPKTYTWIQGHDKESNSTVFLSIARIPYLKMTFQGVISNIIIDKKEYNISTYNNAKILENTKDRVIIKNSKYRLEINILDSKGYKLIAPVLGEMNKEIEECNTGIISVVLSDKTGVLYHNVIENCGIEIVD